ncbi:unnamed protein product [Lupinus luteus]|uniref:Serine-threonine/tyrosine-protein kinase catalytic domain-containing protein n=1 Tax=Lupinus luteus TaxID=3873 RepID=A0AAV1YBF9_LUPLU
MVGAMWMVVSLWLEQYCSEQNSYGFGFGILLLEIVSGKKSIGLYDPSHNRNLIEHAWRWWKDGMAMQLVDECLKESCVQHCLQWLSDEDNKRCIDRSSGEHREKAGCRKVPKRRAFVKALPSPMRPIPQK